MDPAEYLPMFLAEGREHLQNLNLALVRVEQDPASEETANEIFRIAHSLKGMSATMGFSRMAALTHEMENVLELLRANSDGLPPAALDVLFSCLDCLDRMTNEIESDGAEASEPGDLVTRLRALIHGAQQEEPEPQADGAPVDDDDDDEVPVPDAAELAARGLVPVRVVFAPSPDSDMPSVRVFLACQALAENGVVVEATPPIAQIERAEAEPGEVSIVLATSRSADDLRALLEALEGIEIVEVAAAGGRRARKRTGRATTPRARKGKPAAPATQAGETREGQPAAAVPERALEPEGLADDPAALDEGASQRRRQTVRVDADRLDVLMHLMGEMVVQRTRLEAIAQETQNESLSNAVDELARVAQNLQAMVMQVRMVPVESVLARLPRMVRDLSAQLDKQVELRVHGEDTELDRTVVEALGDPLVHLVRNAIDHGIERSAERVAAGKRPVALLEVGAHHAGSDVVITVRDDGRGVDPLAVAGVAARRGLIEPERVPDVTLEEAIELLFSPGFSTTEQATDISGRGVGLDAVRMMVRSLGGDAHVTSEPGAGSCATIRLPLTLAILPALLVRTPGVSAPFALPLDRVEQALRLSDHTVRTIGGEHAITLRGSILPLYDLGAALGGPAIDPEGASAVVVRAREQRVGLLVAELVGQQELVTRPLPQVVAATRSAVSGGAVLGDGEIALIVDCDEILQRLP